MVSTDGSTSLVERRRRRCLFPRHFYCHIQPTAHHPLSFVFSTHQSIPDTIYNQTITKPTTTNQFPIFKKSSHHHSSSCCSVTFFHLLLIAPVSSLITHLVLPISTHNSRNPVQSLVEKCFGHTTESKLTQRPPRLITRVLPSEDTESNEHKPLLQPRGH